MAALRNIALNPAMPLAAVQVAGTFADATRLWDDPRSWWIGYTGVLDILQHTPHSTAREQAAYLGAESAQRFRVARRI